MEPAPSSDAADGAPGHRGTCTSATDCPVVTSGASHHTETSPIGSGSVKRHCTSRMGSASTCLGNAILLSVFLLFFNFVIMWMLYDILGLERWIGILS